jgi:N-methylhydantoinase A
VTDAHLLLARLDPEHFLGGEFKLNVRAAEQGFAEFLRHVSVGRRTAWLRWQTRQASFKTPQELAAGMLAVSNATMEKALRVISVERGHDPRDFALICFGGAGGLHAAELARALRFPRVIVPRDPGAFSALGILLSDVVKDASQSLLVAVPAHENSFLPRWNRGSGGFQSFLQNLAQRFERLERQARDELRRAGFAAESATAERHLEVRYRGQSYELSVPFRADFPEIFQQEHEKAYGYAHVGRALEIVNLRLRLVIRTPKPRLEEARPSRNPDPRPAWLKTRGVWFQGRPRPTCFYARERLEAGARLPGPAVIVEYSSTTVVPPDFVCHADRHLNLVLSTGRA